MNEGEHIDGFSFIKILIGLEKFQSMKPQDKNDFLSVLMRYLIHQEAKLDLIEKDLELSMHDVELLKSSHGVV